MLERKLEDLERFLDSLIQEVERTGDTENFNKFYERTKKQIDEIRKRLIDNNEPLGKI